MQCRLGRVQRRNGNADIGILQKTGNADETNKLNDNGVAAASPVRTRARTLSEHVIVKRQKGEGSWNVYTQHSTSGTHCTSPIRALNAAQRHVAIVSVTPGIPFAWLALESMPTSMAVEMT
jgi:hypothetical protein